MYTETTNQGLGTIFLKKEFYENLNSPLKVRHFLSPSPLWEATQLMERLDNLYPREALDYGERQVSIHTGEGFLMWHFTQAPYFYTQFFHRYFPMKQGVLFEMGLIPRLWLESYDNSSPFVFKIVRLFLAQPCMSKFHFNQLYLEKRNQDHFIFSSRGVLFISPMGLGESRRVNSDI